MQTRRVATQPPTPERSGVLRRKPKELRSTPENIPEEVPPVSFRRRNFYSGGLRKSSGVFRSSVKSTPEPSGMFFPEDSGGFRRIIKKTPEPSGRSQKELRSTLEASGNHSGGGIFCRLLEGKFLLRKSSGAFRRSSGGLGINSGALRNTPEY